MIKSVWSVVEYIEDNLNTKIRSHYEEWGEFMEIFECRNLIAHGNNVINLHYSQNCNRHGFKVSEDKVGKRLSLDEGYLSRSSDRLLEFGLSLMFVLWLKHFEGSEETAYRRLNQLAYELIKDGESRVAAKLLDLALFKQSLSASDRVQKMMTINLANAYRKLDDDEKARRVRVPYGDKWGHAAVARSTGGLMLSLAGSDRAAISAAHA